MDTLIKGPTHILGVGWRSKPFPTPYLRLRSLEGRDPPFTVSLTQGVDFGHAVGNERFCIGYEYERGRHEVCPNHAVVEGSNTQCPECLSDDFYSCRMTCQGSFCRPKSTNAKALCDLNVTTLYLTYVGGGFKVGVSLNPIKRWLEQGSYFGCSLWVGHGLTARFYEHTIGANLGLKLAVQRRTKIDLLGSPTPSLEEVTPEFLSLVGRVKKLNLLEEKIGSNCQVTDLRSYYGGIPSLPRKPILENQSLVGKVVGVKGKLLVLQDKGTYYVTDLGKLVGKVVSRKSKLTQVKPKQRTLFDF